ncbi:mCG1037521, partial [Mus musculus]
GASHLPGSLEGLSHPPRSTTYNFRDPPFRVSLYSPGCPGTHFIDQTGLELRNPPASASQVLGLKMCTTTVRLIEELKNKKKQKKKTKKKTKPW